MKKWRENVLKVGLGVVIGVGSTLAYQNMPWQRIGNTISNTASSAANFVQRTASSASKRISEAIKAAREGRAPGADFGKGGLVDEIWEHPSKAKMGPNEYSRDGTHIRVEQYYNVDMFANPGNIFRVGEKKESPFRKRLTIEEDLRGQKIEGRERIVNFIGNISNLTGKVMQR